MAGRNAGFRAMRDARASRIAPTRLEREIRGAVAGARVASPPVAPRRVARARRGKNEKDTLQAGERSNEASASRASRGDAPSFTLKILSRRGALASFGTSASSAAASAYVTTETRGRRAGLARPAPAGTRGPRRAPARDPLASPTRRPNDPARAVDELAVDDIAARVVAVDMACVLVPARAPLTRTTARHRVYSKHHRYFLSASKRTVRERSGPSTVCARRAIRAASR